MDPKQAELKEAIFWLFVGAIDHHVHNCETIRWPDLHPICRKPCCPTCCSTCSTLMWFRDEADAYLTRLLNRFQTGTKFDWQFWDGRVDWSQIEAHWDDRGIDCHNRAELVIVPDEQVEELREP